MSVERTLSGEQRWHVEHGRAEDVLRCIPDASVDAIVTDPPYGLGSREPSVNEIVAFLQGAELNTGGDFMGKRWTVPSVAFWRECFRILKPGGHLLSFGGTRTVDLITLGIRAGGFEIRDSFDWIYGSGFPKSHNVALAIDRHLGVQSEVTGERMLGGNAAVSCRDKGGTYGVGVGTAPAISVAVKRGASPEAQAAEGRGTALKPSREPIILARKPLEGTIAENVLVHGTGGLNIDASRVYTDWSERSESWKASGHSAKPSAEKIAAPSGNGIECHQGGRWPTNVLLSHSPGCRRVGARLVANGGGDVRGEAAGSARRHQATFGTDRRARGPWQKYGDEDGFETVDAWKCIDGCPVATLDAQSLAAGMHGAGAPRDGARNAAGAGLFGIAGGDGHRFGDAGGASRFFPILDLDDEEPFLYATKASRAEREAGCGALPKRGDGERSRATAHADGTVGVNTSDGRANAHPTVKPLSVMRWLVRLVTPPGGVVVDPCCGSGTTLIAAVLEGFRGIGIEQMPRADHEEDIDAVAIARARITHWEANGKPKRANAGAVVEADPRQTTIFERIGASR